jgi:hypothetical protein
VDPTATAQAAQHAAQHAVQHHMSFVQMPQHWPAQADLLNWAQNMGPGTAVILLVGGAIYLLFGWYAFKGLVTVNAALVGGCIGAVVANKLSEAAPVGAIVGGVLLAATAWPMMKYAVAMQGGIFGALVGAALWRSSSLDPNLAWSGAMLGLILFGLLSFIIFKGSVMMYTSLQGAVMVIFGLLGLAFKYDSIAPQIAKHLEVKPFLLPLAIFIPTVLGLIYQQSQQAGDAAAAGKKK